MPWALRTAICCRQRTCWACVRAGGSRATTLLTEEDYTRQARFPDGLVKGDWYIDVHSNKKGLFHQNTYQHGDYYEIPYRSMSQTKPRT